MSSSVPQGVHFGGSNTFLQQVYSAKSTDETQRIYDQWASQYNKDLEEEGYASPERAVQAVVKYLDRRGVAKHGGALTVLDAGCGTGLVAICLASAARSGELLKDGLTDLQIDGLDLSTGMLDIARKTGVYRNLNTADLSQPQPLSGLGEESYDVVTCVGTLTKAHVGAGVLKDFVRVSRRGGGLVVATVLDEIWESGGYKSIISDDLEKYGKVEVLSTEEFGVRKEHQTGARMVVLRRKYLAEEIAHAGIGA